MDIVYLLYGLAFLMLGLVIFVRLESESQLELLGILWMLGVFAFVHGVLEWMSLWRVVRGNNVLLDAAEPAVLLVSFLFLFEFGRRLVRMSVSAEFGATTIGRLLGAWTYLPLIGGMLAGVAFSDQPLLAMTIGSRYLFGFSGSLLTALGFHLYWHNCLKSALSTTDVRHIRTGSQFTTASFLAYAILGGLVAPRSDWFPASVLNQEVFLAAFGIPVQVLRTICAVSIAISVGALLRIFHLEGLHRLRHALQTTERALSDLQKRESLLSSSPVVLYTAASIPPYAIGYVSPNIQQLMGFTPEQVTGHREFWLERMHPDDRRQVLDCLTARHGDGSQQHEYRFRFNDGSFHWIHNEIRLFQDETGKETKFVGYWTDITDQKLAEGVVEQYRAVIQSSHDGFWITDTETRIIEANDSMCRMLGYAREELLRLGIREIEADESPEETAAHVREMMEKGHVQFEARHRRKDGTIINVAVNVLYLPDLGQRFFAFVRDVTARNLAEQQLRIAAIAFESQEGMFITDAGSVIVKVNRAFTEITGYTEADAIGQTPGLLSSGRHDAGFYKVMKDSLANTGFWQGEIWNRRKNGSVYPEWLTISVVKNAQEQVTHYVSALTDITARKSAEDEIRNLAFYDPLTQLPNRRLLHDRLKQALASSTRSGRNGALLFIDLDNFKVLNDTLGHDIGDILLQQVAGRLSTCVREGDTIARLGGDEFVVILEDLSENAAEAASQAEAVGGKILVTLNQTYQLAQYEHSSTPSIGITLFAGHLEVIDELLKRADLAMYQAKAAGRNTLRFFDPEMQAAVVTRAALEADLREAVQKEQFLLYYQVQVDGDGRLTGVEALLRWQHPQRGMISPADFIPLAEETGLILPLGQWVLEMACAQLARWATSQKMAGLTVAVNVSARQFHHENFVGQVLKALDRSGANPHRLKLELTESLLVEDVEDVITKMSALKSKGVSFSLDDFGTGYSSLSYLKLLPLDQLKIDQGFVRDILNDPNDAAIARTVIALAESLGLAVIAEGVEIEAQRELLATQGCHSYQGYLFSRPLPIEEVDALIRRS